MSCDIYSMSLVKYVSNTSVLPQVARRCASSKYLKFDKYSMSSVCSMLLVKNVLNTVFFAQVARRCASSKVLLKSNQGEREVEALDKV